MGDGAAAAVAVEAQKPAAAKPLGGGDVQQVQRADIAARNIFAEQIIRQGGHLRERVAAIHKQPRAHIGLQRTNPVARPPEIAPALCQHRLAYHQGLRLRHFSPALHRGMVARVVIGGKKPVGVREGYSGLMHRS